MCGWDFMDAKSVKIFSNKILFDGTTKIFPNKKCNKKRVIVYTVSTLTHYQIVYWKRLIDLVKKTYNTSIYTHTHTHLYIYLYVYI
jgi:hypothetical protein